jgi:hypothetical protein
MANFAKEVICALEDSISEPVWSDREKPRNITQDIQCLGRDSN